MPGQLVHSSGSSNKDSFFSLCYLDDFVRFESSFEKATQAYSRLLSLAADLGLDLAPDKCIPPTIFLVWLGFTIDTVSMSMSLPPEKVREVLDECCTWRTKTMASRKQINHLSKCIKPATRFTNRLLAALHSTLFVGQHRFDRDLNDLEWLRSSINLSMHSFSSCQPHGRCGF